jgi:hypothetical protein
VIQVLASTGIDEAFGRNHSCSVIRTHLAGTHPFRGTLQK